MKGAASNIAKDDVVLMIVGASDLYLMSFWNRW
jgi:hypothetical protein